MIPTTPLALSAALALAGAVARRGSSAIDDLPDYAMAPGHSMRTGQLVDVEGRYRVGIPGGRSVVFDARRGAGAMPHNQNVVYMGYVAWITPSQFLSLSPPLDMDFSAGRVSEMAEALTKIAWGPPTLFVNFDGEAFVVRSHEGRHRMVALSMFGIGGTPIPVHVILESSLRSRDLDPHSLLHQPLESCDRTASVSPMAVAWAPSAHHELPTLRVR